MKPNKTLEAYLRLIEAGFTEPQAHLIVNLLEEETKERHDELKESKK